jgi:hypothetical protein
MSLPTTFAPFSHPAEGQFLQVTENVGEPVTLRVRTREIVVVKRDEQLFKPMWTLMKWDDDVRRGGYEDLDSEMRTYLLTYLLHGAESFLRS